MNAELFFKHFDRISEAEEALPLLGRFIHDLAVRGKLAKQDPKEEPATELLATLDSSARGSYSWPANWVHTTIGKVLDFQYGKGLAANERREKGRVRVFGSNGVVGFCEHALSEESAIIIGRKGSAGALNLCEGPSWTTDVAYFVVPPSFLNVRFLLIALRTLNLETLGKGVKPGLSRNDVFELPIAIPPLAEQRRIVAKVDELMSLCERLEEAQKECEARRNRLAAASNHQLSDGTHADGRLESARFFINHLHHLTARPEQVKQIRQTILDLAVRGELIAHNSEDEPASELLMRLRAQKSKLVKFGSIPKSKSTDGAPITLAFRPPAKWEAIRLAEACQLVTSGSRGWAEFYSEQGPMFIRAQNIRFGKLLGHDLAHVNPPQKSEGSRTRVSHGDLLVVITGAGVTNPALLTQELGEAYVSQHVALIKPITTDLSPWLLLCLMAPAGGRAELVERAYGAGKPGLNLDNIRSLSLPLPPLPEQRRIVERVDELMAVCDRLEAQLTHITAESHNMLNAVLHEALHSEFVAAKDADRELRFEGHDAGAMA